MPVTDVRSDPDESRPATIHRQSAAARGAVIAAIAFLTLVDLFAAQAILPALAVRYGASPGTIGVAVNACTLGMAVGSIAVAFLTMRLNRRAAIVTSLALLALPTTLLAHAPDLMTFAALRIAQGLCMATAFTLTLAYLGETLTGAEAAAASAAYISGNVASNLVGRLASSILSDTVGLEANFYVFALLNLAGAALGAVAIGRMTPVRSTDHPSRAKSPRELTYGSDLLAAFAIGFCILFSFIGVFSYVNFVLSRQPFTVGPMQLGFVYLVFVPSLLTTPLAGRLAAWFGAAAAIRASLAVALAGLALVLTPVFAAVLAGLALIGVGTFSAQAVATGYVARTMAVDRGLASGLYLGSYFIGGLAGAAVLGVVFDRIGWGACVGAVSACLLVAVVLAARLRSNGA